MINCCANPNCSAKYCNSACARTSCANGPTGVEFFWLCPSCAPNFDISVNSGKQVHLHPRRRDRRVSLIHIQTEHATHTTV